jgi:hypothetical protein
VPFRPGTLPGLMVVNRKRPSASTGTSAKQRLIARFDLEKTIPSYALGYRWDIVLRGRDATPMEK